MRRFANAGQTRDTLTRVVKHTFASVEDEDVARQSVLKHPTLFAQSSLYFQKKRVKSSFRLTWCSLIWSGSDVQFDACELCGASCCMGVRCDNPFPHDFMNTVRCVSPVVGTAFLVEPISLGSLVLGLPCLSRDSSQMFGFGVSALCVCDQLNFHNCTKCVDRFSMLGCAEILINVEPHQDTLMEFRCASTFSTFLCARPGSWVLTLSLRRRSREKFPSTALYALTKHILPHTRVTVCNMVACGSYGRPG